MGKKGVSGRAEGKVVRLSTFTEKFYTKRDFFLIFSKDFQIRKSLESRGGMVLPPIGDVDKAEKNLKELSTFYFEHFLHACYV